MSLDTHVEAFGYNGFDQISRFNCTKTKTQLEGSNTGVDDHVARDKKLTSLSTEWCVTWSQIWLVTEDGRIQLHGYNDKEFSRVLDEVNLNATCIRVLGNDAILFSSNACWVLADGESTVCKLASEENQWKLVDNTEEQLIAVNEAGLLHEGCLQGNHGNWSLTFTPVVTTLKVKSVACGFEHVLVLSDQGAVYSYGAGSRGQLGYGEASVDPVCRPTRIQTLDSVSVTSVAAGGWHSVAVTGDGDMYVWGWNESGQLGLPNGKYDDTRSLPDTRMESEQVAERDEVTDNKVSGPIGTEADDDNQTQENTDRGCGVDGAQMENTGSNKSIQNTGKSCGDGDTQIRTENSCSNKGACRGRDSGDEYIPILAENSGSNESIHRNIDSNSDDGNTAILAETSGSNKNIPGNTDRDCGDEYTSMLTENSDSNQSTCIQNIDSKCSDDTPILTEDSDSNRGHYRNLHAYAGGEVPLRLYQQIDRVQVQTVPYGLDIPDDMTVRQVACGSRHTCVLFDTGHLMTAGWNGYGQLCHGDRRSRSYLETVGQFIEKNESVTRIVSKYWNTIVYTRTNNR